MLRAKVIRVPVADRLEQELNTLFHRKGIGPDKLVVVRITALQHTRSSESPPAREYVALVLYRD